MGYVLARVSEILYLGQRTQFTVSCKLSSHSLCVSCDPDQRLLITEATSHITFKSIRVMELPSLWLPVWRASYCLMEHCPKPLFTVLSKASSLMSKVLLYAITTIKQPARLGRTKPQLALSGAFTFLSSKPFGTSESEIDPLAA